MAKYMIQITQTWKCIKFIDTDSRAQADRLAEDMARGMTPANSLMDFESQSVEVIKKTPEVGDRVKIIRMEGEPKYTGKVGTIDHIDDAGQIHGTWGGCALIPEEDKFVIIGGRYGYLGNDSDHSI